MTVELGNLRSAWRHWVDKGALDQLYALIDGLWAPTTPGAGITPPSSSRATCSA